MITTPISITPCRYFAVDTQSAAAYSLRIPVLLSRSGLKNTPDGIPLKLILDKSESLTSDPIMGGYSEEAYRLKTGASGVELFFSGPRGLRYGLKTLGQLASGAPLPSLEIVDRPRFPLRGLIEGFYGPPWKEEQRFRAMDFMADRGMNAFLYAPKDDEKHRASWREFYDDTEFSMLHRLVDHAHELDLDFWYCIGPGLTMSYASESDREALFAKLFQIAQLGVVNFGLLLDDIPEELQHEADLATFEDLSEAHAYIGNLTRQRLAAFNPGIRLALCPTQYHGKGNEAYISKLGAFLDPRIDLFWTGQEICSRELTLADASLFARTTNRPVLYWDNYPVNDLEMKNDLHIGPYLQRDPHLFRASAGIVVNAMENAESTLIPLATVAEYLWNPESYDAEAAWVRAIVDVAGSHDAEAFMTFAQNCRKSHIEPTDSPGLRGAFDRAEFHMSRGELETALSILDKEVERLETAAKTLNCGLENLALGTEIKPWILKYSAGVKLLSDAIEVLRTRNEEKRNSLGLSLNAYMADPVHIFSDVLYPRIRQIADGL